MLAIRMVEPDDVMSVAEDDREASQSVVMK